MSLHLHTLPNGLRIVTEPMARMKSASVGIWVAAGGRHEAAEQNGIAHFLEHMAFKGTKTRSPLQIAEEIEEGGLEEGVELGEGFAALGPQGVRRVQNARDPLLLGEGRKGDL